MKKKVLSIIFISFTLLVCSFYMICFPKVVNAYTINTQQDWDDNNETVSNIDIIHGNIELANGETSGSYESIMMNTGNYVSCNYIQLFSGQFDNWTWDKTIFGSSSGTNDPCVVYRPSNATYPWWMFGNDN